jgi:hypothetical protein
MSNPELLRLYEAEIRTISRTQGAAAGIARANAIIAEQGSPAAGKVANDGVYYPTESLQMGPGAAPGGYHFGPGAG